MRGRQRLRQRKRAAVVALGATAAGIASIAEFLRRRRRQKGGWMSEGNKEIVRRYLEEPWGGNLDVLDELVGREFVGYDPSQPEPTRGVEGVKDFYRAYLGAFPDGRVKVDDLVAEADRVAARWTGRGTHQGELMGIAPTGKQVTVTGQSFLRLSDGKIVEDYSNWDTLGMMVQLGVVPEMARA